MVNISLIVGNAGTGKSYKLREFIHGIHKLQKTYVVLAFTHSAVNNLKNTDEFKDNDNFMTIHKYFKIDYTKNTIMFYDFKQLDYMLIDEFTLISKKIFLLIFPIICKTVKNLILIGDYKQLSPIDNDNCINYDLLTKYVKEFKIIDDYSLQSLKTYNDSILSLPEIQNNIKKVRELTEIKRNDKNILDIINNLCFNDDQDSLKINLLNSLSISSSTLINLLLHDDFVFISSKYSILYDINKLITINYDITMLPISETEIVNIRDNESVIFTDNVDDFNNGDELIVKEITQIKRRELIEENNNKRYHNITEYKLLLQDKHTNEYKYYTNKYIPILPSYMTTYHKSQGRTLNNVILCIDNLFEYQMLYTGISRAKTTVYFYVHNSKNINDIYNRIIDIAKIYSKTNEIFNRLFFNKY